MATNDVGDSNSTWAVNDLIRFKRLLLIGSESCGYKNIENKDFELSDTQTICRLLESGHGEEMVKGIVTCTQSNPARPESLIFVLAACARMSKDLKTKQAAYKALAEVCKTPAQLFRFVNYAEQVSGHTAPGTGWGRAHRKAVSDWYNSKEGMQLVLALTRVKQWHGWSHKDVMRLAHIKPSKDSTSIILKYIMKGLAKAKETFPNDKLTEEMQTVLQFLEAVDLVKHSKDEHQVAQLVELHKLSQEHVPTWMQNSREVWAILLRQLPLGEIIPQLGRLTGNGVLDALTPENQAQALLDRLNSEENIIESRLNPLDYLIACKTYEAGKTEKSKPKWVTNAAVVDAMNNAFYTSFKNLKPTDKRFLVAVNVNSTRIHGGVLGAPSVRPLVAASSLSMVIARSEQQCELVAFSQTIAPARLTAQMSLQEVCLAISEVSFQVPMGGSDCSLPLLWAAEHQKAVDVFVVITDCTSWSGQIHPSEALKTYRNKLNIPDARLIVCSLSNQSFALADAKDAGMLDVVTFDPAVPHVIQNFANGLL